MARQTPNRQRAESLIEAIEAMGLDESYIPVNTHKRGYITKYYIQKLVKVYLWAKDMAREAEVMKSQLENIAYDTARGNAERAYQVAMEFDIYMNTVGFAKLMAGIKKLDCKEELLDLATKTTYYRDPEASDEAYESFFELMNKVAGTDVHSEVSDYIPYDEEYEMVMEDLYEEGDNRLDYDYWSSNYDYDEYE